MNSYQKLKQDYENIKTHIKQLEEIKETLILENLHLRYRLEKQTKELIKLYKQQNKI